MLCSSVSLAVGLVLLGRSLASKVENIAHENYSNNPGYLAIPVGIVPRSQRNERREEGATQTILKNRDFFYTAQIGIGTPRQNITVLIDTGSSELWVNPDCATAQPQYKAQCDQFGRYDPTKSRTPPVGPFGSEKISFGDNTDASSLTSVDLIFYKDTVAFGSLVLENQKFGVVKESQGQAQGILGLAPDLQAGFNGASPHSLVLSSMVDQNIIASRVFSMNLRHSEDRSGSLIYGGLDRSKFMGRLRKVPMVNGLLGEARLAVSLDTLGVTLPQSNTEFSNPVLGLFKGVMLDSGTTLSRLREDVAMPIIDALGGKSDESGSFVVPCASQDLPGSVDFGFSGKIIRVPLKDFILRIGAVCYVGINLTGGQQILGDTVLRAGYFVFDWDNKAVHIAQAAAEGQKCGKADIVTIGEGNSAVPVSIQGKCSDLSPPLPTTSASKPTETNVADRVKNDAGLMTATYTVTACPTTDPSCTTGEVRTTVVEASPGASSGSGKNGEEGKSGTNPDGETKDSGVGRYGVVGSLVVVLCSISMGGMILAWT